MSESEHQHGAPEGAHCGQHPERPAAFTCPRCGTYACIFCWHPVSGRCDVCLKHDPAAAAPPIPWETTTGSVLSRFFATLASAFRPNRSAPAFARSELHPALIFFLLTALPCAMLSGIIPNTKTLLFGGSFRVIVQGHPTALAIAWDVLLAMLLQLGFFALDLAALGLPYISLVRAYAPDKRAAALRVLAYRVWLIPAASLGLYVAMSCLPGAAIAQASSQPPPWLSTLVALQLCLNLLVLVAMRSTARLACGIGPALSYVVVIVPFTVHLFVQLFVAALVRGTLPKL